MATNIEDKDSLNESEKVFRLIKSFCPDNFTQKAREQIAQELRKMEKIEYHHKEEVGEVGLPPNLLYVVEEDTLDTDV